jgi:tetratricopeptide (TPR) repeat protein
VSEEPPRHTPLPPPPDDDPPSLEEDAFVEDAQAVLDTTLATNQGALAADPSAVRWTKPSSEFLDRRAQYFEPGADERTLPPLDPPPTYGDTDDGEILDGAQLIETSSDENLTVQESGPVAGFLEEHLDQADYYMHQRLHGEARQILEELLRRFPRHPLVHAKLQELEAMAPGSALGPAMEADYERSPDDTSQGPRGFEGELAATDVSRANRGLQAVPQVGETTESRRNIVEKGVLPEDFDTHYDLGIAYKEMGILDDAINEFRIVMQDPAREVMCHMMIGLCYIERGRITDAIGQFKNGLYAPRIQEQEKLALYYELGQAYERLKDTREALYYYEKVMKRDARFRDVERRIAMLRGGPALAATTLPGDDIDAAIDGLGGIDGVTK